MRLQLRTVWKPFDVLQKIVEILQFFSKLIKHSIYQGILVIGRVNAGNEVNGALLAIMNSKSVSRQARLAIHNGVLIFTLMNILYPTSSHQVCELHLPPSGAFTQPPKCPIRFLMIHHFSIELVIHDVASYELEIRGERVARAEVYSLKFKFAPSWLLIIPEVLVSPLLISLRDIVRHHPQSLYCRLRVSTYRDACTLSSAGQELLKAVIISAITYP
ncbi:hypothetical protein EVAR_66905_1 [Eumeta japonica]|uniref:Uncharacterized protein n=1 Tax=Eumeta variegata TaxID=151549 RepID=A0A4C1Z916_EUMVA|nr:hypothetical protein EVAR_66905_1 [Eumeta japonica]